MINLLEISYIFKPVRYIKNLIKFTLIKKLENLLANKKLEQFKEFSILKRQIPQIYNNLKNFDIDHFVEKTWAELLTQLENVLLPDIPFSFLRNNVITYTMFIGSGGDLMKSELKFLKKKVTDEKLKYLLEEDYVGNPLLINAKYLTSHNSIHHLHHIFRFLDTTKCNLSELKTVIEWGGGYGNLAKIFCRLLNSNITYIIIDLPFFSCIQWLYLATIFGANKVKIIQSSDESIDIGKVNLLPLCFLEQYHIECDLFLSTWAISESSKNSQEYVINKNWFGAKHFLLAYGKYSSEFPHDKIPKIAKDKGLIIESIDFLPNNRYAFR